VELQEGDVFGDDLLKLTVEPVVGGDAPDIDDKVFGLAIARPAEREEHTEVRVGRDLKDAFRGEAPELLGPNPSFPESCFQELEFPPDSLPEGLRLA